MIWVAGRSPTLVSHSLRGVAMNLKATTLTYLAIVGYNVALLLQEKALRVNVGPNIAQISRNKDLREVATACSQMQGYKQREFQCARLWVVLSK
jgi:hypothetical protein